MHRVKHSLRRILIDLAGFGLLLLVPFLGPLPGPGGIPLILASLALLSMNHEWAKQLRHRIAQGGGTLSKRFFPDRSEVKLLYDLITLCLVGYGVWLLFNKQNNFDLLLAYSVSTSGMLIFGLNRNRFDRLEAFVRRYSPPKTK